MIQNNNDNSSSVHGEVQTTALNPKLNRIEDGQRCGFNFLISIERGELKGNFWTGQGGNKVGIQFNEIQLNEIVEAINLVRREKERIFWDE